MTPIITYLQCIIYAFNRYSKYWLELGSVLQKAVVNQIKAQCIALSIYMITNFKNKFTLPKKRVKKKKDNQLGVRHMDAPKGHKLPAWFEIIQSNNNNTTSIV